MQSLKVLKIQQYTRECVQRGYKQIIDILLHEK